MTDHGCGTCLFRPLSPQSTKTGTNVAHHPSNTQDLPPTGNTPNLASASSSSDNGKADVRRVAQTVSVEKQGAYNVNNLSKRLKVWKNLWGR